MRVLLPACDSLMDNRHPLTAAIDGGHAQVVAIMLEREPALADTMDFESIQANAKAFGFIALADLAASRIEQREVEASTKNSAQTKIRPARL